MLEGFGGRRFWLSLVSGAGTFTLCWAGRIDGNAYMLTTIGIIGAYITGNTVQKTAAIRADAEPGKV